MCDVMVFLRRGRERADGTGTRIRPTEAILSERKGHTHLYARSGQSILLFLFLGARILSSRHNYCQCVERFMGYLV